MSTPQAPDRGSAGSARKAVPRYRYPAVWAALCVMMGVALHEWRAVEPALFIFAGIACLLAGCIAIRLDRLSSLCLAMGLILCGAALARIESFHYPADEIGLFTSSEPSLAELELLVLEPPKTADVVNHGITSQHMRLECRALSVRTWKGWRSCSGQLSVRINHAHPGLHTGSRFRAIGRLSRPQPAMNPGEFDWADYSRRQRVMAAFSVRGPGQIVMMPPQSRSLLQWLRAEARRCLDLGFDGGTDHELLSALMLGERGPELRSIQDEFQRTGTSHHLATSGMHVGVVALLVFGICRLLCRPPRQSTTLALAATLLYGAVVVPSPPILRSILLAVAIGGGILLRRRAQAIQLLALAMIAMLVIHPLDLYSEGFQLSFLAVASLMLLAGPIGEMLSHTRQEDMRPAAARPHRIKSKLISISATGLSAWLVCVPLVAWHFRQFNPYAIAAGALLEPLVFLSIVAGALKIGMTAALPYLAGVWAAAATLPVAALRWSVAALATVPGTDWVVARPSLWWMGAWYGLICLPLVARGRMGRWRWMGPAAACAMGAVFLLVGRALPADGSVRLCVLSVGAGQCVVAQLPDGHAAIFDAGSQGNGQLFRSCIEPYLRYTAIRSVDAIFISHPNSDHFNAAVDIVRRFGVKKVYLTHQFLTEARNNASAATMLAQMREAHCRVIPLAAGDRVPLDAATSVNVLWPDDSRPLSDNNASLVLAMRHAGQQVLFCGDIQSQAERMLLADPERLHSDLLIAPHHGSNEVTTGDFVRAVNPRWIISSNDHTLTKKQRDFEKVVAQWPLYRTDRSGAVTATIEAERSMRIHPFLQETDLPDRLVQTDADGGG